MTSLQVTTARPIFMAFAKNEPAYIETIVQSVDKQKGIIIVTDPVTGKIGRIHGYPKEIPTIDVNGPFDYEVFRSRDNSVTCQREVWIYTD